MGPNCFSSTAKFAEDFISEHGLDDTFLPNIRQFDKSKELQEKKLFLQN